LADSGIANGRKEIRPFRSQYGNICPFFPKLGKNKLHYLLCLIRVPDVMGSKCQAMGVVLFKYSFE
jgi:hypothetical protein